MEKSLRIRNVSKQYGDVAALQDMSFDVRPGELFGFVGSNGAGKSTTMRIILGVVAADTGTVSVGDQPLDFAGRQRIGYMPEERGLYPKMKVGEQLEYLAKLHGMTAAAASSAVAVWTDRLGIEHRVDDNLADLSLGNQQRAQLAAALVHDPAVLVLDEPFSGLDPVAVDVMSDVLKQKAAQGIPVLFSSHQLELVQRLCHRVGIIARGRMSAVGTVEELRSRGASRLQIRGPAISTRWADRLRGVEKITYHDGDSTTLTINDGVDDQAILAAALAHGPVREFTTSKQDLSDLFREVVSA